MTLTTAEVDVKRIALILLGDKPEVTTDMVAGAVDTALSTQQEETRHSADRARLIREIEAACNVWVESPTALENNADHVEWLADRRAEIEWALWNRYRRYLEDEKQWPRPTIRRLDEVTDQVLKRLEDPARLGRWDRRGMIVGHVQSGKTANYIGLICKAADAGYKLVIVLAGVHNSLRSQTQLRLDEGFLGFDTQQRMSFDQTNTRLGVGRLKGFRFFTVNSLTSSAEKGDFNRTVAKGQGINIGGKDPLLLVVKKNRRILDNLISWATTTKQEVQRGARKPRVPGVPVLVIDDECDHASVNTKDSFDDTGRFDPDVDPTAINGAIRRLLDSFEQTAYVGYTATPFANIFIFKDADTDKYGEDLFPRSFIINLRKSSEYIGASRVFGLDADPERGVEAEEPLPIVRTVADAEDWLPSNHKNGYLVPTEMPGSLKEAVRSFILVCAARAARGQQREHNSMLIHVTRFTSVQAQVADLVTQELTYLQDQIEFGDGSRGPRLPDSLRELWDRDFVATTRYFADPSLPSVTWEEVQAHLHPAAAKIDVRLVNGSARDALEYFGRPNGVSVIAIGGDKLSRGLTLEGLSVSYYLRASRMYDTLLQMGRWFGYRPGYSDLCRLYTTAELQRWYKDITGANEELLDQFDEMALVGGTPDDFGLRVRNSPDGLMVTARAKLRSGFKVRLSFSASISETIMFRRDSTVTRNFGTTVAFVNSLAAVSPPEPKKGNHLWRKVPGQRIADFLRDFETHPGASKAQARTLAAYIVGRLRDDPAELTSWTVAVISNPGNRVDVAGIPVGLTERGKFPADDQLGDTYAIRRLVSPVDEALDLSDQEYESAKRNTREHWDRDRGRSTRTSPPDLPSGPFLRRARPKERGLLLVYLLDPGKAELGSDSPPIVGLALSFPHSASGGEIEYTINNTYWEQEFGAE